MKIREVWGRSPSHCCQWTLHSPREFGTTHPSFLPGHIFPNKTMSIGPSHPNTTGWQSGFPQHPWDIKTPGVKSPEGETPEVASYCRCQSEVFLWLSRLHWILTERKRGLSVGAAQADSLWFHRLGGLSSLLSLPKPMIVCLGKRWGNQTSLLVPSLLISQKQAGCKLKRIIARH